MKKITFLFCLSVLLCGSVFAQSDIKITSFTVNPQSQTVTSGMTVTANIKFEITVSQAGSGANPCDAAEQWSVGGGPIIGGHSQYPVGVNVKHNGSIYKCIKQEHWNAQDYGTPGTTQGNAYWERIGPCQSSGGDELFYWVASLSRDSTWGSIGSLGINMTATAEPINFSGNTSVQLPTHTSGTPRTYSVDRSITFNVPNNDNWNANGNTWYLLVRYGGNSWDANQNPTSWKTPIKMDGKRLTVSSNITVVPNVAKSTTRSSTTAFLKIHKIISLPVLDVIANPPGNNSGSFTFNTRELMVDLRAVVGGNNVDNAIIRYTISQTADGTDPTTSSPQYNSDHKILLTNDLFTNNNVVTLKAFATGDEHDASPIRTWTYTRELPKANGTGAYFDTKGRGGVDSVWIRTSIAVSEDPDSLRLESPWGGAPVIIRKGEFQRNGDVIPVVRKGDNNWIFPPARPAVTSFDTANRGKLFGTEYGKQGDNSGIVQIADSIAPVPVDAIFAQGSIIESVYHQTGKVERNPDTLIVIFSEPTNILSGNNPVFEFFSGINMNLKVIENIGNTVRFEIISDSNIRPMPSADDSLCVLPNRIEENKNGIKQTQKNTTNYVPIRIKDMPYLLIISKVTPIIPGELSDNPILVADFLVKISNPQERNRLNIVAKIVDATGNVVTELNGIGGQGNIYAEIVDNSKKGDVLSSTRIYVKWNGKNRADRNIGSGTYLMLLSVTGPDGVIQTFSEKLGVGTKK